MIDAVGDGHPIVERGPVGGAVEEHGVRRRIVGEAVDLVPGHDGGHGAAGAGDADLDRHRDRGLGQDELAGGGGDLIRDFAGNGAAAGDQLRFIGYGTLAEGASFVQTSANTWQVNSADGTLHDTVAFANSAVLDPSDWFFG